jgi:hypothetical protein
MEYEIKLSGMLSTNLLSAGEEASFFSFTYWQLE